MSTNDKQQSDSWYSELDEAEREDLVTRVVDKLETQDEASIPRRDLLKAAGVGATGLGLGLGAASSGAISADDFVSRASAQSAAAGQVGTASEPVDLFASSVDTDEFFLGADGPATSFEDFGGGAGGLTPVEQNLHLADGVGTTLFKEGVVLDVSSSGWDSNLVESCYPFFNEDEQRFEMLYTGFDGSTEQLGHAWSYDGVNWTKNGSNPVFSPGTAGTWDDGAVTGPFLWREGDTYHLYYIGTDTGGYEQGLKQVGHATTTASDFPTGWTRDSGNPILSPGGTGWRANQLWKQSIVEKGGTYYMFLNSTNGGGDEVIGYATSTDLSNWTAQDADSPLLTTQGTGWESNIVGDPWVVKYGDTWVMYYYGAGSGIAQDGIAITSDANFPTGWTRHPANPVLRVGVSGRYDDKYAHKPKVVQWGSTLYHYYTAVDSNDNRRIALARTRPEGFVSRQTMRRTDGTSTISSTTYAGIPNSDMVLDADSVGLNGEWGEYEAKVIVRGTMSSSTETGYFITTDESDGVQLMDDAEAATISSDSWTNAESDWVSLAPFDSSSGETFAYFGNKGKVTSGTLTIGSIDLVLRRRGAL